MASEAAQKLAMIRQYSISFGRLFRFLFALVALALAVETLLMATGAEPFATSVRIGPTEYSGESIPGVIRFTAWLATVLGMCVMLKLNYHLIRLFDLYKEGRLFDRETVQQIRQTGITVLMLPLLLLFKLVAPYLMPATGVTSEFVSRGGDPFTQIIIGSIIIVVAWVMDVGRELREEQDLVV